MLNGVSTICFGEQGKAKPFNGLLVTGELADGIEKKLGCFKLYVVLLLIISLAFILYIIFPIA
jgi:hypothetical protein